MLYKNTVFYNQMSPFPAIIFVSNMYIKSVTVHYVNPVASSLVCTSVTPWWRLSAANWKRFSLLLLRGPSTVTRLFGRVRQKQETSALRDADFHNLFRMSYARDKKPCSSCHTKLLDGYRLASTRQQHEEASQIQFAGTTPETCLKQK